MKNNLKIKFSFQFLIHFQYEKNQFSLKCEIVLFFDFSFFIETDLVYRKLLFDISRIILATE